MNHKVIGNREILLGYQFYKFYKELDRGHNAKGLWLNLSRNHQNSRKEGVLLLYWDGYLNKLNSCYKFLRKFHTINDIQDKLNFLYHSNHLYTLKLINIVNFSKLIKFTANFINCISKNMSSTSYTIWSIINTSSALRMAWFTLNTINIPSIYTSIASSSKSLIAWSTFALTRWTILHINFIVANSAVYF